MVEVHPELHSGESPALEVELVDLDRNGLNIFMVALML